MYPTLFRIPYIHIPVQSYGVFLALGFLLAIVAARAEAKRLRLLPGLVTRVLLASALLGVLGCRLFYVIHFWRTDFASAQNPIGAAVDLRSGGREAYGGIILCILFVVFYLRYRRVQLLAYLDVLAPAGLLIYAFARIGCFMGGCCWGTISAGPDGRPSIPWAVTFPCGSPAFVEHWKAGLLEPMATAELPKPEARLFSNCALPEMARRRSLPVHPTQLYASLTALLLYGAARGARTIRNRPGFVFALLLLLFPGARIVLDTFRADCPPDAFGVSVHTIISAAMAGLGLVLLVWFAARQSADAGAKISATPRN